LLITVAIAGIWFVPVSIVNGTKFWNEFVYQHHFVRYTSSHFHTSGGFLYYIPVLLLGTYPWTLAPLLGKHGNSEPQVQLKRFCLCWLITILLFFSFSGSKLPGYILPGMPAFIILSSFPLSEFLDGGKKGRYWLVLISALNFLVIAALLLAFPRYAPEFRKLWLVIGIIVLGVMISAIFYFIRKYAASLAAYAAIMFAATLLFIYAFFPQSGWNETRELARRADPYLTADKKLLLYNIYDFGMVFYTNSHVELNPLGYFIDIRTAPRLYEYVRENKQALVMVGNEELPWIREFKLWRVRNIAQGQENSILELESVK
jgi:4-amino-4-deoxy-L-arabinose transferase-like glycosyltransferase